MPTIDEDSKQVRRSTRRTMVKYADNLIRENVTGKNGERNDVVTPRKKRSTTRTDLHNVTPPKQKKENVIAQTTPSSLLKSLKISSPGSKDRDDVGLEPKQLFEDKNVYQSARKALHSTVPISLPGREEEIKELRMFITQHVIEEESGTIYISGPPGTGKTASLSLILNDKQIVSETNKVYVNCTSIKSSTAIFSRIAKELKLNCNGRAEKDHIHAIETYLNRKHKMILLVLDEIDQLENKKQSVLYTIFEWPSRPNSRIILIGIANSLDLTDRVLPRLQSRCELKPKLMHFAPYSKQQIVTVFMERLKEAGVSHVFAPIALQMLAGKVAAISGDVRRALDIGRRVIELVEQNRKQDVFKALENTEDLDGVRPMEEKTVELTQVVNVLNNVYGTTNNLNDEDGDTLPLQQKIILCALLLILKNAKNKDVTIGRLHDVYKRVCTKQNILAVDQGEFGGLCSLIETRGVIRVSGKKNEPRMNKINLEWDQEEVGAVLRDKNLLSVILGDKSALGRI